MAKMKRAIQFQAELNKGQTWDFEVDTQEAYQRQVPSGAKAGAVMEWGGMTVAWNQLASIKTAASKVMNFLNVIIPTSAFRLNHKYYFSDVATESDGTDFSFSTVGFWNATMNKYVRLETTSIRKNGKSAIVASWTALPEGTSENDLTNIVFQYIGANSAEDSRVLAEDLTCIDLTLLFGPGNEPADTSDPRIAQIEAYAAAHPEYNAGELVSALVDSVVEKGANLISIQALQAWWPNDTEVVGDILYVKKNSGGANGIVNKRFPISVPSGAVISAKGVKPQSNMVMSSNARLSFVLANGQILECFLSDKSHTPKEVENVVARNDIIAVYLDYTSSDNFFGIANLMIRLPYASSTYSPYHQTTHPIPSAVQALPGYGWSAGSVGNTVERTENGWQYVQRVGSVDLGTLRWSTKKTSIDAYRYQITLPLMLSDTKNIVTAAYSYVGGGTWTNEIGIGTYRNIIQIFDSAYSDGTAETTAAFVQHVTGVPLYYELATPITTDITALMGDVLAPFAVEAGGSITMHHPKADEGFTIDVPAKIQYITKLSEVSANG